MSLSNKVIVITGASKGIGKACALRVAQDGAKVVINYLTDTAAADEIVEQIGSDRTLAVQADASTINGCTTLVNAAVKKFGKIDVLIPNAGIQPMKGLEQTSEDDFDRAFSINVKGPYFLVQKAVPHMPAGGRIILVSTGVCSFSSIQPSYLLYAATKGSIEQMVRVLSKDLARKEITVNAVAPGPTATALFYQGKSEQVLKAVAGMSPFNRIGTPEEIVGTMAFLAGSECNWVSGQVIRVNGGTMV